MKTDSPLNAGNDDISAAGGKLARLLAIVLLAAGALALVASVAQFLLGMVIPAALILGLAIFLAKAVLHNASGSQEPLSKEMMEFTGKSATEAVKIGARVVRNSSAGFSSCMAGEQMKKK